MLTLVVTVFVASVLGSLHCAGMCGAFLALAVAPVEPGSSGFWRKHATLQASYHGGRLVTYTVLGVIAGALGSVVDLGGDLAGVQRVAAGLAAATILAFGVITLLRVLGWHVPRIPLPGAVQRLSMRAHRRAMALPGIARAGVIGLLTTLLPCGWLYAFVVSAAGTADPATGAVVMAAFWVGTLPVMISLGAGLRAATGKLGTLVPALTAIALCGVGLWSLVGRADIIGSLLPEQVARAMGPREGPPADHLQAVDPHKVCPLCK